MDSRDEAPAGWLNLRLYSGHCFGGWAKRRGRWEASLACTGRMQDGEVSKVCVQRALDGCSYETNGQKHVYRVGERGGKKVRSKIDRKEGKKEGMKRDGRQC